VYKLLAKQERRNLSVRVEDYRHRIAPAPLIGPPGLVATGFLRLRTTNSRSFINDNPFRQLRAGAKWLILLGNSLPSANRNLRSSSDNEALSWLRSLRRQIGFSVAFALSSERQGPSRSLLDASGAG
jgi:hypothetical protein